MSILIKDIEMPKNHNYVTITIWSNGAASYGLHDRGESLVDFRNVEVVSVPPHGRLGDLDDFIKRMTELMQKAEEDDFALGAAWYGTFIRHIELTPTIIPAEEGE